MRAAGAAGLLALRAAPSRALVALDYDGTLAPVVDDPTTAVPAPGAVDVLAALGERVGRVAVVTGRPAGVVVQLGGLDRVAGLVVLGQYGAERWTAGRLHAPAPLPGVAAARLALAGLPDGAGLEDKGLSLVVHTRRSADPTGLQAELEPRLRAIAAGHGLELHLGRLVLELRPPGFDKRAALLSLCVPPPSAVLFAGDDLGDLPAYAAVRTLRAQGVPGVLVCSGSQEGPAALRAQADVVVDGPAGVVDLLAGLL